MGQVRNTGRVRLGFAPERASVRLPCRPPRRPLATASPLAAATARILVLTARLQAPASPLFALIVVLLALGWAAPATTQEAAADPDPAALDSIAAAARVEIGAPALGLAVVRPAAGSATADGGTPEVAVAGVRCADEDAAATSSDLWHWGSIGKSVTATLVARLVEKGVVAWNETVGEHLGGAVPGMRDAYRDVTFLHLLSHRGGIQPNIPLMAFGQFSQHPDDPAAERLRWARIALAQKPVGPMETTFAYSNSGYVLAAAMLESVTGEAWETLVRREVFDPLGMTSAGFGAPWDREPGAQPCGHRPRGGDAAPDENAAAASVAPVRARADNPSPMGPAGRIHMSLGDMGRYLAAHASRRADFLGPGSWDRLHTPPFGGDYAFGWVVRDSGRGWHNGSNTMWYAEVMFGLDGSAAAVVVNDGDLGRVRGPVGSLLERLINDARH